MRAVRISGTENYAEEAPELLKRYESICFADAHRLVMHLIPTAPSRASQHSDTRSSPSNRPKNFAAARCCCIHHR